MRIDPALSRTRRSRAVAGLAAACAAAAAIVAPAAAAVTAPAAPTGLTATLLPNTGLGLTWTDVATDETGYELERCALPACTYVPLIRLGADTTSFTDPAPDSSTRYRVRAVNSAGGSAYAVSNDVFYFTGEQATATFTVSASSGTAPLALTFDGSASVGFAGAAITSWAWSFGDGATATGAVAGHTYTAPGTYVALLEVRSGFTVDRSWVPVYVNPKVLVAPTALTASAPARNRVGLGWTNPASTTTTQLAVQRCTGSTCTGFRTVATLAATVTGWTDTTTSARTTYRYRVQATDGAGTALSNTVSVTTPR